MGANGSFANGSTASEAGRNWETVGSIENIQIIQLKNPKRPNKLPEESHTPDRIYAIFEKDGSDVKGIAGYGADGKKQWEVHTVEHDGICPHTHKWKDGKPETSIDADGNERNQVQPLSPFEKAILDAVRNYGKI